MPVIVTQWTPVLRSLLEETRGVLSRSLLTSACASRTKGFFLSLPF